MSEKAKALFRGKNENNGKWVYGVPIFLGEDVYIVHSFCEGGSYVDEKIDPETLSECVGTSDKNGRKVFVGDIVKICCDCDGYFPNERIVNGVIEYDEFGFHYKISFDHIRYGRNSYLGNYEERDFEIVGNKWDNCNLLAPPSERKMQIDTVIDILLESERFCGETDCSECSQKNKPNCFLERMAESLYDKGYIHPICNGDIFIGKEDVDKIKDLDKNRTDNIKAYAKKETARFVLQQIKTIWKANNGVLQEYVFDKIGESFGLRVD